MLSVHATPASAAIRFNAPRPATPASPVSAVDQASIDAAERERASRATADRLDLLARQLEPQRRVVHAGDVIYHSGADFGKLYILNSGFCKIVNLSVDGREKVVGFKFRGDWMGFDGIADGRYACDAVAMDTGEVWTVRYDAVLAASARQPALLALIHQAMSREIARDRDSLISVCSLPADARVAEFLRYWVEALGRRGMRTDQITLRLTRAEIGNYLGMTLETVSRALSHLARSQLIQFVEKGRREIRIPRAGALSDFVRLSVAQGPSLLQ